MLADNSQSLHLKGLPSGVIADWIREAGEGELAAFAEDTHFVAQLDEITQGFPLSPQRFLGSSRGGFHW